MRPTDFKERPITPKEFEAKMRETQAEYKDDPKAFHSAADDLICDLLRKLGYGEGVEIFETTDK